MAAIGIAYIAFEDYIIEQLPKTKEVEAAAGKPLISRAVLGAQIGLILLAIVTTRSSIASISAKAGLPIGTQIVGWLTFSTFSLFFYLIGNPS
jgi:phosphatidylinositol glycan class N